MFQRSRRSTCCLSRSTRTQTGRGPTEERISPESRSCVIREDAGTISVDRLLYPGLVDRRLSRVGEPRARRRRSTAGNHWNREGDHHQENESRGTLHLTPPL